jgi:putative membrane protein
MKIPGFQRVVLALVITGAGTHFSGQALAQSSDESFAKDAASGGMAAVKLGQLAQRKGASSSVKEFGKHMEMDHSKAGEQLQAVSSKNHISLPSEMSRSDQETYERLSKLSGPEFDKAYSEDMLTDHQKDVAAFKKEASSGKNPDIKQFASDTLPTLEHHLEMAQDLANRAKDSSASR